MNKRNSLLPTLVVNSRYYGELKAIFDGKLLVVSSVSILEPDASEAECAKWFSTACPSGKIYLATKQGDSSIEGLLLAHIQKAKVDVTLQAMEWNWLQELESLVSNPNDVKWRIVYGWPEIKPELAEAPPEPFPVASLPLPAQRFCWAVATAHSCDVGFPALFSLSVMATAIGTSYQLRVKGGRFELPVLWIGVSGRPGCGKSPAMSKAFAPLWKIQNELHDQHRRESAQFREDLERYKKSGDFDMPQKPSRQSLVLTNVTVEALLVELQNSPRGTIFSSDELPFWLSSLNAYKSGGGDRQWWLSSWSSVPVSYTRRNLGNETILIKRPCLGVVGGIQPDKLDILAGVDDGLLGRFLLAAPAETRGEYNRSGLCRESENGWDKFISSLWELPPESSGPGGFVPNTIELSDGAHDSFEMFANGVTAELNEDSMPEILRGTWSKADTMVLRMSLIIHMGKVVSGEESNPKEVSKETMQQAIDLMQYFLAHMQRMVPHFHAGLTKAEKLRQRILSYIERHRGQIRKDDGRLEWSILRSNLRRSITSPSGYRDDLLFTQCLESLQASGHIKLIENDGWHGRPKLASIEVNPCLLSVKA